MTAREVFRRGIVLSASVALGCSIACSASMRPMPDDVDPSGHSSATALADAAVTELGDAGIHHLRVAEDEKPRGCVNAQHHTVRVHQVAPDLYIVGRGVLEILHAETKVTATAQFDPVTAMPLGFSIDDVGDGSCLEALGFRSGDFIESINGRVEVDKATYYLQYQITMKNGSAVVRFDRDGKKRVVVFEVRVE